MEQEKKYILILGGSTFVGKEVLKQFADDDRYIVHYINRGKKYWDNEICQIQNAFYTYGNRDELADYTKLLKYLSNKLGIKQGSCRKWNAVIDFCCFQAKQVKGVYEALSGLIDIYIFISTDSIYDVCDLRKLPKGQPVTEDYDIRPQEDELYEKFKAQEEYGHDKLKCEEFLKFYLKETSEFPYVVFRFPDVIGPYDDTGRMWAYVKWIQQMDQIPLEEDTFTNNEKLSFVYSIDAANLIKDFIVKQLYQQESLINQAYNICQDETITLKDMLFIICQSLGKQNLKINNSNNRARKFYPSVECGVISNQKAKQKLNAQFTSIRDAIEKSCNFFAQIKNGQYLNEDSHASSKLQKKFKD